tara:strand:- start:472 stop:708 length:237 start_codon:yes stop_codon:yes gene_type:complete
MMKIEDYCEAVAWDNQPKCESCDEVFEEADYLPYPEFLDQTKCVDCMTITPEQEQFTEESLNHLRSLLNKGKGRNDGT